MSRIIERISSYRWKLIINVEKFILTFEILFIVLNNNSNQNKIRVSFILNKIIYKIHKKNKIIKKMNNSMAKLYSQDGTGRDSYIFNDNGGFYPENAKL